MLMNAAVMLPTAERACSNPSAIRARAVGHDLGHQRHADGELPSHAQAGQEAIEGEVPRTHGKGAQAREERVDQDGPDHRLGPADAVAQHAERQAPRGPADQEDRRGVPRRLANRRGLRRLAIHGEQLAHRRRAGQVEQLLVHRVEQPAQGGHDQHEPVVARQLACPAIVGVVRRGREGGKLSHSEGLGSFGVRRVEGVSLS